MAGYCQALDGGRPGARSSYATQRMASRMDSARQPALRWQILPALHRRPRVPQQVSTHSLPSCRAAVSVRSENIGLTLAHTGISRTKCVSSPHIPRPPRATPLSSLRSTPRAKLGESARCGRGEVAGVFLFPSRLILSLQDLGSDSELFPQSLSVSFRSRFNVSVLVSSGAWRAYLRLARCHTNPAPFSDSAKLVVQYHPFLMFWASPVVGVVSCHTLLPAQCPSLIVTPVHRVVRAAFVRVPSLSLFPCRERRARLGGGVGPRSKRQPGQESRVTCGAAPHRAVNFPT